MQRNSRGHWSLYHLPSKKRLERLRFTELLEILFESSKPDQWIVWNPQEKKWSWVLKDRILSKIFRLLEMDKKLAPTQLQQVPELPKQFIESTVENRRFARQKLPLLTLLISGSQVLRSKIVDLSRGGLKLELAPEGAPGQWNTCDVYVKGHQDREFVKLGLSLRQVEGARFEFIDSLEQEVFNELCKKAISPSTESA